MAWIFFIIFMIGAKSSFAQNPDIRDVKNPVEWPFHAMPFGILVLVVVVALGVFLFWWWKRKKESSEPQRPVDTQTPWEKAFELLEKLRQQNLLSQSKFEEYYVRLSDIVRRYFEDQFCIKAPEMTTEEFLFSLNRSQALTTRHKESLSEFLSSCDMVKFAQYAPRIEEAEKSFDLAKRLIQETKREILQNGETKDAF